MKVPSEIIPVGLSMGIVVSTAPSLGRILVSEELALLATQMFAPSKNTSSGAVPTAYVPRTVPSIGLNFVTLADAWFATHPEDGLKPPARPDEDLAASFDRARQLRRRLRWLYGLAIAFTVFSFGFELRFDGSGLASARLLALDYPLAFAPVMLAALVCWLGYFWLKRRLR